jgi:hypothetical protein
MMWLAASANGQTISGASGSFATGDTVTIFGAGFGAKSPAAPVLWDDFEAGVNGERVVSAPIGGDYIHTGDVYYTSTGAYSGRMAAVIPYGSANLGLVYRWAVPSADGFATMKVRYGFEDAGSSYPANLKVFRLQSGEDGDYTHGYPVISMDKPQTVNNMRLYLITGESGSYTYLHNWQMGTQWSSLQEMMSLSDDNVPNGMIGGMVNDTAFQQDNIVTWTTNNIADWAIPHHAWGISELYMNGYIGNCSVPCGTSIYMDEVYADSTLARVSIDSDTVWQSMQIPFEWSSSRIRVVFNQGTALPGDTVYLQVVDENGNKSNRFAVTVSGTIVDNAPGAPGQPSHTGTTGG